MGDSPPFGGRTGVVFRIVKIGPLVLCSDGVPWLWHGVFDPYGRFASTARRVRKPENHATNARATGRTSMVLPDRLNTRTGSVDQIFGKSTRLARPGGQARLQGS